MITKRSALTKSILVAICLLLIPGLIVTAATPYKAATKTLSTNYALVNLGDGVAHVLAKYVKPDGEVWDADDANEDFTIPASFGQIGIAQYFDTTLSPGAGSVVISSDQPLGAVVQLLARPPQVATYGAYSGISEAGTNSTFLAPQVFKERTTGSGLANSEIAIQNTTDSTILVNVEFIAFPGIPGITDFTKTGISINPNATYVYDLTTEIELETNWTGAAVISATSGQIAVVVNSFMGPNSLQTYNAFPVDAKSQNWAIPMFTSRLINGLSTPVTIQNVSPGPIAEGAITMSCKALSDDFTPASFDLSNPNEVPINGSTGFNPVADTSIPGGWSGSCTVNSPVDVVVFVQMRRPGVNEELAAYEAFAIEKAGTRVVVPAMSKRQPNGFATTATIKNLDYTNVAKVNLVYTPSPSYVAAGGSSDVIIIPVDIPAGGSIGQNLRFQEVPQIPDRWYGTLLIEPQQGEPGRPIVAVVQLTNYLGIPGDSLMAHNAISLP